MLVYFDSQVNEGMEQPLNSHKVGGLMSSNDPGLYNASVINDVYYRYFEVGVCKDMTPHGSLAVYVSPVHQYCAAVHVEVPPAHTSIMIIINTLLLTDRNI